MSLRTTVTVEAIDDLTGDVFVSASATETHASPVGVQVAEQVAFAAGAAADVVAASLEPHAARLTGHGH